MKTASSGSLFPDSESDAPTGVHATRAANDQTAPPLAERLRPRTLAEIVGPSSLFGEDSFLGRAVRGDRVPSIVFWGPPGSGKTTLAGIIAAGSRRRFVPLSAVNAGVREVREILEEAKRLARSGIQTIVFVDEIHRFNRGQQDVFLPYVESGAATLIGATTENPSFHLNAALLSRLRVVVLPRLGGEDLKALIVRAVRDERGVGGRVVFTEGALDWIASFADGDARRALNAVEVAADHAGTGKSIDVAELEGMFSKRILSYDKAGDEHFNAISALHKSLRDSDVDASLYWLARMLEAGEEPLYVARRMVRMASEDVGLADPLALGIALAGWETVEKLGMPEGALALAQVAVYLALAPKSDAVCVAYGEAVADAMRFASEPVPLTIRNAPTRLLASLGFGQRYASAHDQAEGTAGLRCLPEVVGEPDYYRPAGRGHEAELLKRALEVRAARGRALGRGVSRPRGGSSEPPS